MAGASFVISAFHTILQLKTQGLSAHGQELIQYLDSNDSSMT